VRNIINSTYISLDGVIEAPHAWPPTEASDPAADRIQTDHLLSCDAVVMGRRTYEGFAPVWPTRSGDPLRDRMRLRLEDTTTLQSGIAILSYSVAR
jgi:dihydrofolate reductase